MSEVCRNCLFVDTCKNKRMEALGYLPEQNIAADIAAPLVADMAQPIATAHDYRDVKIAEGMTITIDLEDIKRRMVEDFYRGVGLMPLT